MENYIPIGICKYFRIHSIMPYCLWKVMPVPTMVIASLSQWHCLCHNKFYSPDLENLASRCRSYRHLHFTLWQNIKLLLTPEPFK